jgi:putative ABC transport system substrate-binding protein
MPMIGFVIGQSLNEKRITDFRRGLTEKGYVEGKNIAIEFRSAEGKYDRLPSLVANLMQHQVVVIVAAGGPAAQAARAATAAIPIVFLVGVDPVTSGLVASIGRPGGNATGTTVMGRELNEKRLELLSELVPTASLVGVLVNRNNPYHEIFLRDIKAAANGRGQQILNLYVGAKSDLDAAFANLVQQHADGLVVTDEPLFSTLYAQIVALAARYKIPSIYPFRDRVEAGGLISYGPSITDAYRQLGIYAGRILKGDRPSDLPVLQPTKLETVLNLRTAMALGLTIPPSLLARADEVIE